MDYQDKLKTILARHDELTELLATEMDTQKIIQFSKELKSLEEVVRVGKEYLSTCQGLIDDEQMMNDTSLDAEMKQMATDEYYEFKAKLPELEKQIQILLIPKDETDERNVVLEVRAGTGGEEAALFAEELFRMYEHYAMKQG